MLFKTSQNQKKIRENLFDICGNPYSLAQKIKNRFYGSPKYLLLKISPKNFEIDFEEYTDLVYSTFELRTKGLAAYFRHKNEEYILMSRYNQISFLNNDGLLEVQLNDYTIKLKVVDSKGHKKFIRKLIESRNTSMK
ncbi:hypothetical protein OA183_01115 [Flavobacteriales bacterium]|nr:hypothetical protein [Flavobacteriales bacterium]